MGTWLEKLLSGNFMPHGHCLLWRPDLLAMHVGSDAVIFLSYFIIPFALVYIVRHRRDLAFNWMFLMFGLFILACGTTHLMQILNIWHGYYYAAGAIKIITAIVSMSTAIAIWPLIPKILAIPSNTELAERNTALAASVSAHQQAEHKLKLTMENLERSNNELEKFAYAASHDLKSPLRAIDILSEWIQEDMQEQLDDTNKERLLKLRKRVKRMDALLDDLLNYSKVGKGYLNLSRIGLEQLLQMVIELVYAPDKFTIKLDPAFSELTVQNMPLMQIFQNLISNAIKHHDGNSGNVEVSLVDTADNFYTFAVKDDGPGIPEQFQDKIFEMFQTLKPHDQIESSGIGLALVEKIVKLYGGKIWLESDGKRGSTFFFTWPVNQ